MTNAFFFTFPYEEMWKEKSICMYIINKKKENIYEHIKQVKEKQNVHISFIASDHLYITLKKLIEIIINRI